MKQTDDLKTFWDNFQKQAIIQFPDLEKLKDLLLKVLLKTEELEKSRDKWREKYENLKAGKGEMNETRA